MYSPSPAPFCIDLNLFGGCKISAGEVSIYHEIRGGWELISPRHDPKRVGLARVDALDRVETGRVCGNRLDNLVVPQ